MAGACPVPSPDDPLVRGLLSTTDCNVRELIHTGYASIFQPSGLLVGVLTTLLTLYVALIGYRLMLGRGSLTVGEFALTAIKLGAVLALATQWDTYQALIYHLLFDGPQRLADAMLATVQPQTSDFHGDVFDGLQRAFDDMTSFSTGYANHSPSQASPLLGGVGFGAFLLTTSGSILLISTLGVLLAAKIVLGLLLALGPIFIALFLFDATRGLFEGWLRASLAFAFAPMAMTLFLGVALTMLEPSLERIEALQAQGLYPLGPAYSIMTLILVFVGVAAGSIIAVGLIATGLKLPRRETGPEAARSRSPAAPSEPTIIALPRAARVAAAAAALDRRDARSVFSTSDSRTIVQTSRSSSTQRLGHETGPSSVRLGEQRRLIRPRTPRPSNRTAR